MRDERSDWECVVVGVKVATFIDSKNNYTDFLIERLRLNSYHVSFSKPEDRTQEESYRLDPVTSKLMVWEERDWPGTVRRWTEVNLKEIRKTKPKDLRIGANVD